MHDHSPPAIPTDLRQIVDYYACTNGFPTFNHDNRSKTDTLRLEIGEVDSLSLSSTSHLVRVNLVRFSVTSDFTGR